MTRAEVLGLDSIDLIGGSQDEPAMHGYLKLEDAKNELVHRHGQFGGSLRLFRQTLLGGFDASIDGTPHEVAS